jgi:DNA-binding transcriptional ArsR family regulator
MAKSRAHNASFRAMLRLFALFGHPVRVIIFQRLAGLPQTAGELAKGLPVSRTAVVQHLKLLQAADLVVPSADGRKRVYRIRPQGLAPLESWLKRYR